MKSERRSAFIVQGHRGVRDLDGRGLVENTPQAFIAALKEGAEVELDLQMTSDEELVIYHDHLLSPDHFSNLSEPRAICDLRWEELKNFQRSKNPREPLLSISEVMAEVASEISAEKTFYDFELKYQEPLSERITPDRFAALAIEKIEDAWALENSARLRSFHPEVVRAIKRQRPQLTVVQLTWAHRWNYLELLTETAADILAPHLKFISAVEIEELRKRGYPVIPYAVTGHGSELDLVESPELYHQLFENFDGFTSDSPRQVFAAAEKAGIPTKDL